ncbi:hypothetical protein QTP70_005257, partial [Hemibagrus guttatus]
RRHSHPRSRGHVSSNLIYPPLLFQSQTVVVGGLWNCQSAVRKADFISALASHSSFDFLALTETWISPQNTTTPAALSSAYTFSHSPRESGRGGGTVSVTSPINLFIIVIYCPPGPLGDFLEEMDTLLSVFPSDSTPLTVLGDFNLPSDKLHSSGLLALLNSFSLSFNICPPTHKEGNVLDLVFTHPSPATDMTATPLHISDHHLVSFTITLPILPKHNSQHLSLTHQNLHSISPSSVASCTLSSLPDHDSFSSLPLDSATDTLLSSLSSTMDLLCPLSTIRKKNCSTAHWLSDVPCNNQRELRSAVRKWKKSKLITDLISFRMLLSKSGHMSDSLSKYENFSSIAAPLSDFMKKGQPDRMQWTEEAKHRFQALKTALTSDPVLRNPDFNRRRTTPQWNGKSWPPSGPSTSYGMPGLLNSQRQLAQSLVGYYGDSIHTTTNNNTAGAPRTTPARKLKRKCHFSTMDSTDQLGQGAELEQHHKHKR